MAYRSLGIGFKCYIIEQSLLDWQFVYICRNCQAATGTVRSISQTEHKTAKNETDERESEYLARRRDMSVGQNQFNRQDSVSFHYLEHAHFCCIRLGANKACCSDMQNVLFTPTFTSNKDNRAQTMAIT